MEFTVAGVQDNNLTVEGRMYPLTHKYGQLDNKGEREYRQGQEKKVIKCFGVCQCAKGVENCNPQGKEVAKNDKHFYIENFNYFLLNLEKQIH